MCFLPFLIQPGGPHHSLTANFPQKNGPRLGIAHLETSCLPSPPSGVEWTPGQTLVHWHLLSMYFKFLCVVGPSLYLLSRLSFLFPHLYSFCALFFCPEKNLTSIPKKEKEKKVKTTETQNLRKKNLEKKKQKNTRQFFQLY